MNQFYMCCVPIFTASTENLQYTSHKLQIFSTTGSEYWNATMEYDVTTYITYVIFTNGKLSSNLPVTLIYIIYNIPFYCFYITLIYNSVYWIIVRIQRGGCCSFQLFPFSTLKFFALSLFSTLKYIFNTFQAQKILKNASKINVDFNQSHYREYVANVPKYSVVSCQIIVIQSTSNQFDANWIAILFLTTDNAEYLHRILQWTLVFMKVRTCRGKIPIKGDILYRMY